MGIADRYQIYAEHDAKAVNEAYQKFFANLNEANKNMKMEEKKMEKKEEKKQITSKQAIKAIGRNFGRWVKDHKWQIAGCAVGTAVAGSIWHKSSAIVDQEHEQIALYNDKWDGNEHCFDADGYFNWKKDPDDRWSLTFVLEPTVSSINIDPKEFDEIMELIKKDYHDDYEAMWDALAEN